MSNYYRFFCPNSKCVSITKYGKKNKVKFRKTKKDQKPNFIIFKCTVCGQLIGVPKKE